MPRNFDERRLCYLDGFFTVRIELRAWTRASRDTYRR